jgi:hypothetical protein
MRRTLTYLRLLSLAVLVLVACGNPPKVINEQTAVDAAWQALDPYTSSHNRAYWQATTVRLEQGANVAKEFEHNPIGSGCWGPTPTPNISISSNTTYWYVVMQKKPMTAVPKTRVSPTEPPLVPDWNIYEAHFLVDANNSQVLARSLRCIVI